MADCIESHTPTEGQPPVPTPSVQSIYPLTFSARSFSMASSVYLHDPSLRKLVEFFENKGLAAIKNEDQRQQWYEDWIACQAQHQIYASLLSPKELSNFGHQLDLLRLTRFLEVFAYFSPAHGYSLQVSFLGLFSILMGSNAALKREAVAALEQGGLFAFGVSEKDHGSDLLANEFTVATVGPGKYFANGGKYYIGNANSAAMISILARKVDGTSNRARRALPVLFALRPAQSKAFGNVRKIPTLGIRAAFVGEFQVKDHELTDADVIAEGRSAWEAVLGTVTLGKFFLGFGSIGICERAFEEATAHLSRRVLYAKPIIGMPHISFAVSQAYARLTAMKLYAYRALDYVQSSSAKDRRYLLFCAVQKARVSTEGVKVISLLSECIGAHGFQADTYFEMALRDVQLIPGLEGSTHINLGLTAQFISRYFNQADSGLAVPPSFAAGQVVPGENAYLMEASGGLIPTVSFPPYINAYKPLASVPNVRIFARQVKAFRLFARSRTLRARAADTQITLALGQCLATIVYGQLVAENAAHCQIPPQMVSAMFHLLISDLSAAVLNLASFNRDVSRTLLARMVAIPKTSDADWSFVLERARMAGGEAAADPGQHV